jgi:hypothetical protein
MILTKKHVVQVPHIDHFSAFASGSVTESEQKSFVRRSGFRNAQFCERVILPHRATAGRGQAFKTGAWGNNPFLSASRARLRLQRKPLRLRLSSRAVRVDTFAKATRRPRVEVCKKESPRFTVVFYGVNTFVV